MRRTPTVPVGWAGTEKTLSIARHAWPCVAAAVFVLGMVACRYDSRTGLTSLLRFGDRLDHRVPEVAELPLKIYPGAGYDGQYYAQLAVDPDVRKAEVQHAMDYPQYRPRRIFVSALVYLISGPNAWVTLHVYALANLVVWLGLGWLLWRRVSPLGWHGTAVWLPCMLSLGALDSVRMALTDLPALLGIFLAVAAVERGWRVPAVAGLAVAALTRDTALLAAAAVENGDLRFARVWRRHGINLLAIIAPLAAWTGWILVHVPSGTVAGFGHFAWPGVALVTQLATCGRELSAGNFDPRYIFGMLAVFSFGWQAVYVLRRITPAALADQPWLRVGVPFAVFYFVLGDAVWNGYWAIARTCLPLTFAFNLILPRDRWFWRHLLLGNVCLLHGVYRFLPEI